MSTLNQEQLQVQSLEERAILVACHLPGGRYDEMDPLGELRSLVETAGAVPVGEMIQNRRKPDVASYLGKGKIEELKALKDELRATMIVFDNDLTPSQIRNIERVAECKIIDRSELILDIFAGRATTAAAKIQVELAQLEYTYPRLRAMWSHLGQITGGAPVGIGTRGPGEQQIEIDRRLVQRRKSQLKERIAEIHHRKQREVQQRKSDHFTVCCVGYTNAGKSTMFNSITEPHGGGGAYADDRLFATLTTRTRQWPLGGGDAAMLSDTVGFVRDLPHHLVASFRATLEEAMHADLLLLVIDVADPQASVHYDVVSETLDELIKDQIAATRRQQKKADEPDVSTIDERFDRNATAIKAARSPYDDDQIGPARLVLLNKADLLEDHGELAIWHQREPTAIPVSAKTGMGLDEVQDRVRACFQGPEGEYVLRFPLSAGKAIAFAENRGTVVDREYDANSCTLRLRIGSLHVERLRALGATVVEPAP